MLSAGLFAFAVSVVYFSITLSRLVSALPELLDEIQVIEDKLDPLVNEVKEIRLQIPGIVEEVSLVRGQIPPTLEEIDKILEQIPAILSEVEEIRGALPAILEEAAAYREQIPLVLEQVEAIQVQIPEIIKQVDAINGQIPEILAQVEAVREEIPQHLDQAERISMNIEEAGQSAGEGAVQGVFTGLIKAPMSIVIGIGESVIGGSEFSESDRALLIQTIEQLVDGGEPGDELDWKNDSNRLRGTVRIISIDNQGDRVCMTLNITAYQRLKKIVDKDQVVCKTVDGNWELRE